MRYLILGLALLFASVPALAVTPQQRLSQLVDYIAVDYPGAVRDGQVLNTVEYNEMLDFAENVQNLAAKLDDSPLKQAIIGNARELRQRIEDKADGAEVSALSARLRQQLINGYELPATPTRAPDMKLGARLYAENCAGCHGAEGRGDGPQARGMEPPPIDFTDRERYRSRTLYGLYGVITHGVEGTAMKAFPDLTDEQRWALAFHIGQLAPTAEQKQAGRQHLLDGLTENSQFSLQQLTTATPAEIEKQYGPRAADTFAWLRSHPKSLFRQKGENPLQLASRRIQQSLAAYRAGDARKAHELAVSAYLDGFEEIEGNLDAINKPLRLKIENAMTGLRQDIRKKVGTAQLEQRAETLQQLLAEAGSQLSGTRLSPLAAFISALLILLREGLEAILVIAALAAFLIKTERRDGLRYLTYGVGGALLLGVATWWASRFILIGGAGRELVEGLAALFAAVMLFYVGFWLNSKTGVAQWKAFIQGSIEKALGSGALWGLSSLAFIAVYREIFESVLFYQALWLQTDPSGQQMVLIGFLVAFAGLILLAWLILRFSTRLPLRQFFTVTAWFMFVLAVVFAGNGIAALQEAGKIPADLIPFPRIELLGIYPTLQSLGLQLLMIVVALYLFLRGGGNRPSQA